MGRGDDKDSEPPLIVLMHVIVPVVLPATFSNRKDPFSVQYIYTWDGVMSYKYMI